MMETNELPSETFNLANVEIKCLIALYGVFILVWGTREREKR